LPARPARQVAGAGGDRGGPADRDGQVPGGVKTALAGSTGRQITAMHGGCGWRTGRRAVKTTSWPPDRDPVRTRGGRKKRRPPYQARRYRKSGLADADRRAVKATPWPPDGGSVQSTAGVRQGADRPTPQRGATRRGGLPLFPPLPALACSARRASAAARACSRLSQALPSWLRGGRPVCWVSSLPTFLLPGGVEFLRRAA